MPKKFYSFVCFIASLFIQGTSLQACSICGCGDPLQAAGDALPVPGGFRLTLDGEYLTAKADDEGDPGRVDLLTQKTLAAGLAYSPTQDLSLTLQLPFVIKEAKGEGGSLPDESLTASGLGDLNLGFRYFLWRDADWQAKGSQAFAVSAGSYIPTGPNNLEDAGTRIDEHDQLGAGSWAPYGGIFYALRQGSWNVTAHFTAVLHAANSYSYRYGDALKWGLQGKYDLAENLALSLGAEGRHADQDNDTGLAVDNTGGTVADLTPGLWLSPLEGFGLYSRIQIPVFTNLVGAQTVGPTVTVGTQFILK